MLLALIFIWRSKELIYDFIQVSLEIRTSPTNCRRAVQKITEKFEKLYLKYRSALLWFRMRAIV